MNKEEFFCSGDNSYANLEFNHQNLIEEFTYNKILVNRQIDNSYGQLSINYGKLEENERKRIQIEVAIKKISCGHKYSLLLCSESDIFIFFWDNDEQLEIVSCREKLLNTIKLKYCNKIIELESYYHNDTSVALSENGFYYVWRKNYEGVLNTSKSTELKCFEDIFAEFIMNSFQCSSHIIKYFIPNGKYTNNWEELERIGRGSYGKVFKVKHKVINDTISAVKKIPMKIENSIEEIITSSLILKFNNDHLVRYYDVWCENDYKLTNGVKYHTEQYIIYIEMDLCDKTLKDIKEEIKNYHELYSNKSLTYLGYYVLSGMFAEIFEGVKYLHNKSIIHRDLNPFNILVKMQTNGNCIKIADFGLAVVHEINKLHTMDRGNVNYMAPEIMSKRNYDTKADIYNLGVTLNEMFDLDSKRSTDLDMGSKYEYLEKLYKSMISISPQNRPDCQEILEERKKWAIDENDWDFQEKLKFYSEISDGNRGFVQNIIFSKLSHVEENFKLLF